LNDSTIKEVETLIGCEGNVIFSIGTPPASTGGSVPKRQGFALPFAVKAGIAVILPAWLQLESRAFNRILLV